MKDVARSLSRYRTTNNVVTEDSGMTRIWNLPLRIFHWGLVACYITAWFTRDSRYLDIHIFAGYMMIGLILFRLFWGIAGGPYARFRDFSFSWRQVVDYLRGILKRNPERFVGHNPAGSWVIFLLLGMSGAMAVTGLMTFGGEEQHGPLAGLLTFAQGDRVHQLHELLAWFTLVIIGIHLAGVVVESLLLRENLVRSMISGFKPATANAVSGASYRKTGIAMLLVIMFSGAYWFQGYSISTSDNPYRPFVGPELADNALWREECGSCHLAFHPSLLPERSWRRMLLEQDSHFGEDLFLDAETIAELEAFLVENAAEWEPTEAAWKINRSIPANESPLAITGTGYWKEKHQEFPDQVWKHELVKQKGNCAACHLDADKGTFEDGAMRLPAGF